jgi:cytosine/adenosine deaminase-related metal-dependent hydrolase
MTAARYHAEYAWLDDAPAADVLIEVAGGRFTSLAAGVPAPPDATRLAGLVLPGFANAHSHAFHRALRGRTHGGRGDFWTWREQMYAVAAGLDPDRYLDLATAVYAEMALAGVTCVGEFHYLHHAPDGTPYADPNAMGRALIEAARRVGIRITLLDALYLTATVDGAPLSGVQRRFGDRDVAAWADRVSALADDRHARVGVAVHSVRAVPPAALTEIAALTKGPAPGEGTAPAQGTAPAEGTAPTRGRPVHLHLSEQRAENDACRARHGRTPSQLLAEHGLLGQRTTAVHGTHLTGDDIALLGRHGTAVCLCPTTERDLADGIGPARELADAGVPLCLGSDSHAVVDLFEEARAVEMHERLRTERRGHFTAAALIRAATVAGHAACGWDDAGTLAVGRRADLVCVRLDSPRTAGLDPAAVVFAATAADVTDVVVDGRPVVHDGRHTAIDVGPALRGALT